MSNIFIGIDLAWGEKNLSGFSVLEDGGKKLNILDVKLLDSIDNIIKEIQKYEKYRILVGVDAPLLVPNESGNREIEKNFNKDFAKYKISMLPANRKLLTKHSSKIRSEELFKRLSQIGFKRDYKSDKVVFEVYPHSTIAVCFNNFKILPYKRKKGRDTAFIKEQLNIYKKHLKSVMLKHGILKEDIANLRGQSLKDYEDKLDSLTCAYTMQYCLDNDKVIYQLEGVDTFITPFSSWYVYILRCSDDTLYTGITTDIKRREQEHNESKKGAKYTKQRRPVKLVYSERCDDKSDASKKEYAIKKLSREEKLKLINSAL